MCVFFNKFKQNIPAPSQIICCVYTPQNKEQERRGSLKWAKLAKLGTEYFKIHKIFRRNPGFVTDIIKSGYAYEDPVAIDP